MSCSRSSPASSGPSAPGWRVPTCRAWSCGGRPPRPRASMPQKSPHRARNPISPRRCVALVFASLAFWLVGGMLRTGFPGNVDFGALTVALAEIPLLLGTCLLAARLFREEHLAVAFAVLLAATDPVFEVVGVAVQAATRLDAIELDAGAVYWAFVALGFVVLPRALYVLTGWRGRPSVLAFGLFAGLLAILVTVFPRTELWITAQDDRAEAARPRLTQEEVFHRQG